MKTAAVSPGDQWENFLHRKPLVLDRDRTAHALSGKRILITGAGGWIGSALTIAIATFAPQQLVLLEAAERNLYEIMAALERLPGSVPATPILGSVTDPLLVARLFQQHRPQIVYHAAAFKHVPLMEHNPFAAIENNALGTHLLLQAAERYQAQQFLLLSTDKAVDPVNIMGASKRVAELVLLARRRAGTRTKAVRLGNVLGSEGSVVPLFRRQILAGVPLTITHPDARRYFLTTADAVTLLLHASWANADRSILVPDLEDPISLQLLAQYLITHTPKTGGAAVPVIFTQLRPGDKLCEALLSSREAYISLPSEALLGSVESPSLAPAILDEILQHLQQACREGSLEKLLTAVACAVPEYHPSTLLQEAVRAATAEQPI